MVIEIQKGGFYMSQWTSDDDEAKLPRCL